MYTAFTVFELFIEKSYRYLTKGRSAELSNHIFNRYVCLILEVIFF